MHVIVIQGTEFSSLTMKEDYAVIKTVQLLYLQNLKYNLVLVNVNYNEHIRERHQISYNQLAQLGLSFLKGG